MRLEANDERRGSDSAPPLTTTNGARVNPPSIELRGVFKLFSKVGPLNLTRLAGFDLAFRLWSEAKLFLYLMSLMQ